MRKSLITMMFTIAIATAFSQTPLSITEYIIVEGKRIAVTRNSSTEVLEKKAVIVPEKIFGSLVAVYDCEGQCSPKDKRLKLVQIDEATKEWTYTFFDFRCLDRGNFSVLESGRWFVSHIPLEKDEVAVIECIADGTNLTTQYEVITFSKRDVMRKIYVPDYGQMKVTVMKITDFILNNRAESRD